MSRVALSEFRGKTLVLQALGRTYVGLSIDLETKTYSQQIAELPKGHYVVKLDQAVKKRNKSGLVMLNRSKTQVIKDLATLKKQGFRYALVEPFFEHEADDEHYIALATQSDGTHLSYSPKGGVDIEKHAKTLQHAVLTGDFDAAQNTTAAPNELVARLYELFRKTHMTLLEINPCVFQGKDYVPLDAAVQVDSAAQFFVEGLWSEADIREPAGQLSSYEKAVERLNAKSPASFNLKLINPNGKYFLLLSGGGASVVVADEFAHLGHHKNIANYGEYSGNPGEDETYDYAKQVLKLMLDSESDQKVLVIAGGIANFTDVAKTFTGIIRAMRDTAEELIKQNIKVVVRRGGPNQESGLGAMRNFLQEIGLTHHVFGSDVSLAKTISTATEGAAK